MDSSKMKIVYSISERDGKNYFSRIGVAFINSDGSLNVKLEAVPVNGELHIRDYVTSEEDAAAIKFKGARADEAAAATSDSFKAIARQRVEAPEFRRAAAQFARDFSTARGTSKRSR